MPDCTSSFDPTALIQALQRHTPFRAFDAVARTHPRRAEAEAFVAARYRQAFDAQLSRCMPTLIAFDDAQGRLAAVVGARRAMDDALFVEQYLDLPAEVAVGQALRQRVSRRELVEVGNLAASRPGETRALVLAMTLLLEAAGFRWVLFAATTALRNACQRLALEPVTLAEARRERLAPDGSDWGRYYETQPRVVCGDLRQGVARLRSTLAADPASATDTGPFGLAMAPRA